MYSEQASLPDLSAQDSGLLPSLEESLQTTWDANILAYDPLKYPFAEWIFEYILSLGYAVTSLETLHKDLDPIELYDLAKKLCLATQNKDFRRLLDDFVQEVIIPQGQLETPVATQRFLNVRIMPPNSPQTIFPFHTGLLYGHGAASRSLWMPLTDVSADADLSASMQIIKVKRSRELVQYAKDKALGIDEMNQLFAQESFSLRCKPGLITLFGQENLHGNFENVTEKTRVSIDFRLAESKYSQCFNRKPLGGYFAFDEKLPKPKQNKYPNILYLNNSTPETERVPVHLQRYMLLDYCKKQDLTYEFENFELEDMPHLPTLNHILNTLNCNIVSYSIHSLPEKAQYFDAIVDRAINNQCILYFANEDMFIDDEKSKQRVWGLIQMKAA